MATLTINFVGTCTHFDKNTDLGFDLPVPYRVVFPRTDTTTITTEGLDGPVSFTFALQPQLRLPDQTIGLNGVRMYIDGDMTLEPGRGPSCIPHLRAIWPDMELNRPMVLDGSSPAAAYFDVFGGTINGFNERESAAASLTIEVSSPTAVLVMQGFDETFAREIPITLPQTITIESHPLSTPEVEPGDLPGQAAEIQLNFLVAAQMPPPLLPGVDEKIRQIVDCLSLPGDAGPGCSNSQYP